MNKIDIHEICVLVEERFFTELTLYNEEYFKIDIKEDLTLKILLERLKNAKEKYKKEYSELYSSEFVVAFLEYYCKKSNFIAIYKNEKIIFTILYAFMKAIQENINSDPYSYMSIKNGAMRNLSHYKVYFKGDISVFSFENIFEDFNFRDYYYISPFLKNINIKSDEHKFYNIWGYLNQRKTNQLRNGYKTDEIFIGLYLIQFSRKWNKININKILNKEKVESRDDFIKLEKEFGFIADEIIKKIDEELKTDSFLCDNFYENFYLLKPLVFKNTVTTMIGCGVMPIGDFFMLGGQLIDKE